MNLRALLFILTILLSNNSYSQSSKLEKKEIELIKLFNKLNSNSNTDSIFFYSKKIEENFTALVKNNPETINYSFKKLLNKKHCYINTSDDGKLRIYSWDDGNGGSMRYFTSIIQWKNNDKVFSKVVEEKDEIYSNFCSKIYTVKMQNNLTYFAITNSIGSSKDVGQAISAYRLIGNELATPKVFKTKNKTLNYIDVYFDFFSVVNRPERPLKLIKFNKNRQSIVIPLVNDKGAVKNKALVYQLKPSGYFEYTGVETYKFN